VLERLQRFPQGEPIHVAPELSGISQAALHA